MIRKHVLLRIWRLVKKRRRGPGNKIVLYREEVIKLFPSSLAKKTIGPLELLICQPKQELQAVWQEERQDGGDNVQLVSTLNIVLDKVHVEITSSMQMGPDHAILSELNNEDREMF